STLHHRRQKRVRNAEGCEIRHRHHPHGLFRSCLIHKPPAPCPCVVDENIWCPDLPRYPRRYVVHRLRVAEIDRIDQPLGAWAERPGHLSQFCFASGQEQWSGTGSSDCASESSTDATGG